MSDEVTLPVTESDLDMWRRERDEMAPTLQQGLARYRMLTRRIDAIEEIERLTKEKPPVSGGRPRRF